MNKDPVDSLYIMCVIRPFLVLFIGTNTPFKEGGGACLIGCYQSKGGKCKRRFKKKERTEDGGGSKRDENRGHVKQM